MSAQSHSICSVEHAGSLDNSMRRWLQNPQKILKPYVKEGMTVLDMGCGPGFFSIPMAHLVGKSGRVIAADVQEGMLHKLKDKIQGTELEERLSIHQCGEQTIGLSEDVDFILAFYMVHEIPNHATFFQEIRSKLKPNGQVFIAEPPFHVSKTAFEAMVKKAREAGLSPVGRPKLFLNKTVILSKKHT